MDAPDAPAPLLAAIAAAAADVRPVRAWFPTWQVGGHRVTRHTERGPDSARILGCTCRGWAPPRIERRANAFAIELLLPLQGVLRTVGKTWEALSDEDVKFLEDVYEVFVRIDALELAAADERVQRRDGRRPALRPREQPALPARDSLSEQQKSPSTSGFTTTGPLNTGNPPPQSRLPPK